MFRLVLGFAGSGAIAIVALRKRALTGDGAVAAVGTGTLTTGYGGYSRALLLIAFFTASTLLSRLGRERKRAFADQLAKGSTRDARQVLANGGVSTAIAVLGGGSAAIQPYVGALAAVTADTWATEIGGLSKSNPRHILTFKTVPAGSSGGVTLLGALASVAGGTFIGSVAAATRNLEHCLRSRSLLVILTGTLAGTVGSLVDSVLGATIQERRWCPVCDIPTERRVHGCGHATKLVGGIRGIDNDVVNLFCSITGATTGFIADRVYNRGNAPR